MKPYKLLPMTLPLLLSFLLIGCAGSVKVRSLYEDNRTSVRLQTDREAGTGHSHPSALSPGDMARILGGVLVVEQRYAMHELLSGSAPALAAFSADEIRVLAPLLSQALSKATPREIVTFYRRYTSDAVGLAYTTGGLFVHDGNIHFVLANYRQSPSDVMRRGIPAYEMDPIDDPLQSLLRGKYEIMFQPEEAEVHPAKGNWTWPYADPGKVVVINAVLATSRSHDRETQNSASPVP
ncbi:hypothetical protein [Petrachloros mirabilis]